MLDIFNGIKLEWGQINSYHIAQMTAIVVNQPERKLAKRTSVHWLSNFN